MSTLPVIWQSIRPVFANVQKPYIDSPAPFEETRYGRYRKNTISNRQHLRCSEELRRHKCRVNRRPRAYKGNNSFPKREQETQMQFLRRMHEDYTLPLRIATPPPDFSLLETPIHSKKQIKRQKHHRKRPHRIERLDQPTSNRYSRKLKLRENDDESSTNLVSVSDASAKGDSLPDECGKHGQKKTFREDNNHLKLSSSTRRVKIRSLARRNMTKLAKRIITEALTSPRLKPRDPNNTLGLNLRAFGSTEPNEKYREKTLMNRERRIRSHSQVLTDVAPRRTSRVKDALRT